MGIVGGSIFNFYGGAKNAPKGFNHRLYGGLARTRLKAPVLGGQFAAWCLCYASFECSLSAIRKKEDHWNSIASGAGAGVVMAARYIFFTFCYLETKNVSKFLRFLITFFFKFLTSKSAKNFQKLSIVA